MDVLSVIGIAVSIIGIIVKIATGGKDDPVTHYYDSQPVELFPETALDTLIICYETFKLQNFNIRQVESDLKNSNHTYFSVHGTQLKNNCLNLNVQYLDVFDKKGKNGEMKEFRVRANAYFSINLLQGANNVMIYGATNYNPRTIENYKKIANEIRKIIST